MVECQPSKLNTWDRYPSSAPHICPRDGMVDIVDLKSTGCNDRVGSSPTLGTKDAGLAQFGRATAL